uniref:Uncharacterized protein n=1 Tax=Ditylenchus dipsaci TaxID=166011 RepID=A0A915D565_9BILA
MQVSNQASISKREISVDPMPGDFGHEVVCRDGLWMCPNSTKCIVASWRCDGRLDCAKGEDELNCMSGRDDLFVYKLLKLDTDKETEIGRKVLEKTLRKINPDELEQFSKIAKNYVDSYVAKEAGMQFLGWCLITLALFLLISLLHRFAKKQQAIQE